MTEKSPSLVTSKTLIEPEFEGFYGKYKITLVDQLEVKRYRISVLVCAISFCCGLTQWLAIGPNLAWIWLITMTISLGLALQWIHIYILFLHNALKIFWAVGSLGVLFLLFNIGPQEMLSSIASKPILELFIGPFFMALTGLGFKEFFCFRRPEAIGMTFFIPIALLGHLLGVLSLSSVMSLLFISAILLLIMAVRKFGVDAALDIGDKSVFEYLDNQKTAESSGI
ncbi:DUF2301 domain-containing membrane protein [Prochlorococcus marinus]|uniref:Permeases of the major facilitator n=1 Tax=Prochlorococcus marinus (strain MIT 9211) TaxID=93059 RepID=A9BDI7_PROM4|nr:DUF2301 domain-containing membrane protein [Prochlorococcus marinus]ABX08173.1 Hypothetical protein P9211_02421 [Prochlorococcus marinus str. MIT 9211]